MHPAPSIAPSIAPAPAPDPDLLMIGVPADEPLIAGLRNLYRVTVAPTIAMVRQYLAQRLPVVVVTEISVPDGSVTDICKEVKRRANSPAILLTTKEAARVPEGLIAGCDAVLLQPFAPNLLYARIGRLVRLRAAANALSAAQRLSPGHVSPFAAERLGTNTVWADETCPQCQQPGATCFDFAGYRRAWFACLKCQQVWVGRRRE